MDSLKVTDDASAAVATAPRVSLAEIEAKIEKQYTFTGREAVNAVLGFSDPALATLTICILVMRNGFTVIGKSASASPENFNEVLGHRLAYEDAVRQVWPLEGYALREKLAAAT